MPEGPSIVILREEAQQFKGKKIVRVEGNSTKIDLKGLEKKTITDFKSWGKHFLICFKHVTIRIHLLMFGSYRINEHKDATPRLGFQFKDGELNFYTCSVKEITENLDEVYDWTADVMNPAWDAKKAKAKLMKKGEMMVCDAILDQQIFSGAGNIIKNEVLYRIKVHPESKISALPAKKINELIKETVHYSFEFLKWKKEFTLRQHWLAHTKTVCHRCNLPIQKKHTGKTNRRSFFCINCQKLYAELTLL
jgi:endonuclease-8